MGLPNVITAIWRRMCPVRRVEFQKPALQQSSEDRARLLGVTLGENCRILAVPEVAFDSEPFLVKLGNHVTVASRVQFITHDGGVWVFREEFPEIDVFGPIVVGNNVFLGYGVTILPGVTIGDNVVVGACSVVTRDIPSNCVAAGVPARRISSLDDYKDRCLRQATHFRNKPMAEKRGLLLKHFKSQLS